MGILYYLYASRNNMFRIDNSIIYIYIVLY